MTQTPTDTDTIILAAATAEPTKIAAIIAKAYDALEAQGVPASKTLGQEIAERIYVLIDNGALECQGNMRRWRDADVKLPLSTSGAAPNSVA